MLEVGVDAMKSENATQWLQNNPFRSSEKAGSKPSVRCAGYYSIHRNVFGDISPSHKQPFLHCWYHILLSWDFRFDFLAEQHSTVNCICMELGVPISVRSASGNIGGLFAFFKGIQSGTTTASSFR
jgi:hypothetical protein